jgi:GNAT superfamily N-acetyltransferase
MSNSMAVPALRQIGQLSERHLEQLHALYQNEWWSKGRSLEATRAGVLGSQLCVGLVTPADELAAFARVLSDFTFKALIFDVIVAPEHRQAGLGDEVMSRIVGHERLQGVKSFELYCLPEMMPFYHRHGFSEEVGAIRLMRRMLGPEGRHQSGDQRKAKG